MPNCFFSGSCDGEHAIIGETSSAIRATSDKPSMRIAYIINSGEGGGAALPVPAIANVLRNCGADVKLFALTRRDGRALPPMTAARLPHLVRDGDERDHFSALKWLDQQVLGFKPDIIWTSLTRATLLGQLVGARQNIPVVSWQHAAFLRPANRRLLRATRRLTSLWIGDSFAVTEFAARELLVQRCHLATWPIFAADVAAPQARPWQPGEPVRIASLGRLHQVKGYDILIAAVARLSAHGQPFEVTVAGEGDELDNLQLEARRAGLKNFKLAGFVGDPRAFLATQHLYVQPSRSEGFCVAAHEAMQAGLPVVASAVGEMNQSIASGGTGYLVPPGDSAALAAALAHCLDHPHLLQGMGQAGREHLLERFSESQFQQAAEVIYRRLVELCRSGQPLSPPATGRSA